MEEEENDKKLSSSSISVASLDQIELQEIRGQALNESVIKPMTPVFMNSSPDKSPYFS